MAVTLELKQSESKFEDRLENTPGEEDVADLKRISRIRFVSRSTTFNLDLKILLDL